MASGCEVVTTNLGALYETCAPFGTFVNFNRNLANLEKDFSITLENSIKNFWSDANQKKIDLQRKATNIAYSWKTRSEEWSNFFNKARQIKN